jgi:hypothetical protein
MCNHSCTPSSYMFSKNKNLVNITQRSRSHKQVIDHWNSRRRSLHQATPTLTPKKRSQHTGTNVLFRPIRWHLCYFVLSSVTLDRRVLFCPISSYMLPRQWFSPLPISSSLWALQINDLQHALYILTVFLQRLDHAQQLLQTSKCSCVESPPFTSSVLLCPISNFLCPIRVTSLCYHLVL